jgi:peptidylamidoglycolate lyase
MYYLDFFQRLFKYSQNKQILILCESFVSGSYSSHFCKPIDVVVSNDSLNNYFADEYCSSRVVKYDSKERFLKEYRVPDGEKALIVPRSLTLIESVNLLCVTDRENEQ